MIYRTLLALISIFTVAISASCAPAPAIAQPDYEESQVGAPDAATGVDAANPVMRILLSRSFSSAEHVYVTANGPFRIQDDQGATIANGDSNSSLEISATADIEAPGSYRATLEPAEVDAAHRVSAAFLVATTFEPGTTLQLSGSETGKRIAYRGSVAFTGQAGGRLRLVNSLALEDYVQGVVRAEIGGDAPMEALKAQAVAARTYAVHNFGRLWQEGADIDDTTRSQGFEGLAGETPNVLDACRATRGQVIVYGGSVIDAMYCTECGGTTAQGPLNEPYLRPVKTPGCETKALWSVNLDKKELDALARAANGTAIGPIKSVDVGKTDASGRALDIVLTGSDGTKTMKAARMRQVLGVDNLRSTLFTIKPSGDGAFIVSGHGWGHGLGMCQGGAVAKASGAHPESYDQILADYYPGTQIVPLTADLVRRAQPAIGSADRVSRR